MPPSPQRRPHPVTLQQAAEESPTLARLAQLARESAEQLKAVESLIPAALRSAVQAGPIEENSWCLLVDGNAAAAKLRQLLPALLNRLRERGSQVTAIRLKVQIARR
ncbi:DciA family protein [Ramlibacter sp.]|uniref:DciA family protein n=1 Tax=Ramlibacter sp. TaxID=1917967 RepID=UPI002BDAC9D3|nr:DciA family protein [Ramlibacter sp.]HWI84533.1 DciA family protein [Ramlibacter sp.]